MQVFHSGNFLKVSPALVFCSVETTWLGNKHDCESIHTSLEKIHVLNGGAFVLLCWGLNNDVHFVVVKQVIIAKQITKQHIAVLSCSLCTIPAGLPPPMLASPRWCRRCGLLIEVDSSHHGSIYWGADALPVHTGEMRACVPTAH